MENSTYLFALYFKKSMQRCTLQNNYLMRVSSGNYCLDYEHQAASNLHRTVRKKWCVGNSSYLLITTKATRRL
ncbi:LOW QUALITY PROTEIN: hypothetical protein V1477_020759 [Vespula maculifrons]|uniref:Uncharacterized protein n=1 Tax=Vespula maculifrons TaxID=7453 RepID=A0ABD2AMV7_VESMC